MLLALRIWYSEDETNSYVELVY